MSTTVTRTIHSLKALRRELRKLVEYNWHDELDDFEQEGQQQPDGGKDHIFVSLVALGNWLDGTTITVEDYVATERANADSHRRALGLQTCGADVAGKPCIDERGHQGDHHPLGDE